MGARSYLCRESNDQTKPAVVDKLYSTPQSAAMQTHPCYIDRVHSSCRDATERSGIEAGLLVAQAAHWKLLPTHSVDHRSMRGKSTNSCIRTYSLTCQNMLNSQEAYNSPFRSTSTMISRS